MASLAGVRGVAGSLARIANPPPQRHLYPNPIATRPRRTQFACLKLSPSRSTRAGSACREGFAQAQAEIVRTARRLAGALRLLPPASCLLQLPGYSSSTTRHNMSSAPPSKIFLARPPPLQAIRHGPQPAHPCAASVLEPAVSLPRRQHLPACCSLSAHRPLILQMRPALPTAPGPVPPPG